MISLKGVSKKFGDKLVLNDINLILKPGITFIVGSSGAGKSTLLNLIGGLDTVSSGCIIYNGTDIVSNLTSYRAENVGFIFQDFNLVSGLSVRKNIELGLLYSENKASISEIDSQISKLDLKDKNQCVETLSGGEKQRVAIIRSICKKSDIILADEPTGNLDSTNAHIVFNSLVNMKHDKYIVVVSHDLELAHKYGDRIITMSDGKIVNDTSPEEINSTLIDTPGNNVSYYKNCVNWSSVFMLGCNSLKMRFSKILSIALVISLTISVLAIVFSFNNIGNNVSKNVNVNYLESDLAKIFYSYTGNLGYKQTPFNQENIEHIKKTYNTNNIVPVYMERDTWFFSNQNLTQQAIIKQINIDEFFEERIMSYEIEGDFIKDENDIILAEDVAQTLFGDSCIGKEISLNDGSGENIVFKIVGINKTVNPFDKIYSIVSSLKIKELLEKELTSALKNRLELNEYKDKKSTEAITVTTGGIYGPMKVVDGSENYVYGRPPENKNEIIISSALLPYAFSGFNIECGYSETDIINGNLPKEVIRELTTKKIALNHNGLFELYITGVYQYDQIEMKFQPSIIPDLQQINPTVIDIYLPQTVNVADVQKQINSNEEYICLLQLEDLKINIAMQTTFFKWAIILVGSILILVSIAMLSSFFKIAVLERKKEIAIIKSLGANDTETLCTLLFDTITISVIALLLSLLNTGIFLTALPHIITDMSFINFEYPYIAIITIGICFTVFVCVYTLISLKKIVRQTPASLFKQ